MFHHNSCNKTAKAKETNLQIRKIKNKNKNFLHLILSDLNNKNKKTLSKKGNKHQKDNNKILLLWALIWETKNNYLRLAYRNRRILQNLVEWDHLLFLLNRNQEEKLIIKKEKVNLLGFHNTWQV